MKKIAFIAFLSGLLQTGCVTKVDIPVAEPWEGRYPTVEEFRKKTESIELKNGQSIWVLSNGTMYRLLKKTEK
jgi:hypothetical protein